jgi:hypothetical protein
MQRGAAGLRKAHHFSFVIPAQAHGRTPKKWHCEVKLPRHCERERCNPVGRWMMRCSGLLRCARNDE